MAEATKTEEKEVATKKGAAQEYYDAQGAKSKENKSNGGEEVKVSLTNKTKVRFIKDFGFMKKGDEQEVSDVALAIYEGKKVIEKL